MYISNNNLPTVEVKKIEIKKQIINEKEELIIKEQSRIEFLKQEIQNGNYKINLNKLAEVIAEKIKSQ